jgi:hypothetical protein
MENPMMKIFLGEFKSTPCKLERPTAVTVAKTMQKTPPMIGSGIEMKIAPIFPMRAKRIMSVPAAWITRRDPEGKPTPARSAQ